MIHYNFIFLCFTTKFDINFIVNRIEYKIMDIKLPSGLSPNKKKLIKRLFNQWKDHLYEGNLLNLILTDNHIFIDGINLIPRKFFGQLKKY